MATVIQAQDKSGKYMKYDTKSKMKYILDYVHDPEKTRSELQGGTLLMNPENAYDEFMLTKQLWGKDQECVCTTYNRLNLEKLPQNWQSRLQMNL